MTDLESLAAVLYSPVTAGVLAGVFLLLLYAAGSTTDRASVQAAEPVLNFSQTAAGALACAALALAGVVQVLLHCGLEVAALMVLLASPFAGALVFAVGRACKKRHAGTVLEVIGGLVCAPARLLYRCAGLRAGYDLTHREVHTFVESVEQQALIDESQKEMITNIFELADVCADSLMTHRTDLVMLAADATAEQAVQLARAQGVSRIPVYRKGPDDIIGMLHIKDLLALWNSPECSTRLVSELMRKPMFVPETCRAKQLLAEFQRLHTQIAVVIDEYGGTAGVVTMEDILEGIVGDMQDEFDNEEADIRVHADGIDAVGEADLEQVLTALGLKMPDDAADLDFDTVGGLVADRLGRIPDADERAQVVWGGACFTVTGADERHITMVHGALCAKQEAANEESAVHF